MNFKRSKIYWDVFISHASEDKKVVVLPLTNILKKSGLTVWLDKHELFIGDSIRRKKIGRASCRERL